MSPILAKNSQREHHGQKRSATSLTVTCLRHAMQRSIQERTTKIACTTPVVATSAATVNASALLSRRTPR